MQQQQPHDIACVWQTSSLLSTPFAHGDTALLPALHAQCALMLRGLAAAALLTQFRNAHEEGLSLSRH